MESYKSASTMNNNHSVIFIIDKLRVWCAGAWKSYNTNNSSSNNIHLRIHYDQILIISGNKILESLNLNSKIKGIYKSDVLILITCSSNQQVRKIKFQIKTNTADCLHTLSMHFPVVNYSNIADSQHHTKYKNIEDVLKNAIIDQGRDGASFKLPTNFKDFVKICLLDPCFPNYVEETQDVFKKLDII